MDFHKNYNEHRDLEVKWLDCMLGDKLCVVSTYCPMAVLDFFTGNKLSGAWCWLTDCHLVLRFTIHGCISALPYTFVISCVFRPRDNFTFTSNNTTWHLCKLWKCRWH